MAKSCGGQSSLLPHLPRGCQSVPRQQGQQGVFPGSYRVSMYAFSATFQTLTERSWEPLYSWCVPLRKDRPCGQMDMGAAVRGSGEDSAARPDRHCG